MFGIRMNMASTTETTENKWAVSPHPGVAASRETIEGVRWITADDLMDQAAFKKHVREELPGSLDMSCGLGEKIQRRVIADSHEDLHAPIHQRTWLSGGLWIDGRARDHGLPE